MASKAKATPEVAALPPEAGELLREACRVADNLFWQRRLESDVKDAGARGSYPREFPDWDKAWKRLSDLSWSIVRYLNTGAYDGPEGDGDGE